MPAMQKTFPVRQKPIKDSTTTMQTVEEIVKALDLLNRQIYDALDKLEKIVLISGGIDHALTANLSYALSGHTGFQPAGSYLTAETDPVFAGHAAYGVTPTRISRWDTAYNWGNHAGLYSLFGHDHQDMTRYFGDSTTDGSWRITVNGTGLNFERRESGIWVKKGGVTA
jgi:hypothetical protein